MKEMRKHGVLLNDIFKCTCNSKGITVITQYFVFFFLLFLFTHIKSSLRHGFQM